MSKKKTEAKLLPNDYTVILSPVVTEKATNGSAFGQVTFRVLSSATKPLIRAAVEKIFDVKVKAVNTLNRKGKSKTFRGRPGQRSDVKIAVVTLAEGSKIDITNGI